MVEPTCSCSCFSQGEGVCEEEVVNRRQPEKGFNRKWKLESESIFRKMYFWPIIPWHCHELGQHPDGGFHQCWIGLLPQSGSNNGVGNTLEKVRLTLGAMIPGKSLVGSISRSTSTPGQYGPRSWGKGKSSSRAEVSKVATTTLGLSPASCVFICITSCLSPAYYLEQLHVDSVCTEGSL